MKFGKIEGNDYNNLIMNDAINAFRIAVGDNISLQSMVDMFVDEYEDETGVDTGNSVNILYDSTNDYYSMGEGDTTAIDNMEYATDGDAQTAYKNYTLASGDTKLLLHFDGEDGDTNIVDATNNHIITVDGDTHIEADAYKWGSTSCYFDGSDRLSIPDSTDWDLFGSIIGSWTLDFWIKFDDYTATNLIMGQKTDNNNLWQFKLYNSQFRVLGISSSAFVDTGNVGTISDNNWHHLALCKVDEKYGLYFDGSQIGYDTLAEVDEIRFTGLLYIGGYYSTDGIFYYLPGGYMDEFRIIHSNIFNATPNATPNDTIDIPTGRHGLESGDSDLLTFSEDTIKEQGSYALKIEATQTDSLNEILTKPFSTPLDLSNRDTIKFSARATRTGTNFKAKIHQVNSDVKLLLHCNGDDNAITFKDYSPSNHDITVGGTAKVDTGNKKWGSGSLELDGNSDYLEFADSNDWDIFGSNSDDWTIDLWAKHTTHTAYDTYLAQYDGGDSNNYWWFTHNHGVGIWMYFRSGGTDRLSISGGEITDSNWHHIAMCKVGNEYGIYKDGTQVAYGTTDEVMTTSQKMYVGSFGGTVAHWLDGYMDEVRVIQSNVFSASPNSTPDDTIVVPTGAFYAPEEYSVEILSANTWETKEWDISGVASGDKDAITHIEFEIINADSANTIYIDEMYAYANATGFTLISENQTAESEPDEARIVILMEEVSAITLNTDLKAWASKDDGSTYAQVTLEDVGDYGDSIKILYGEVDLTQSGIGSGTDIVYRLTTHNSKNCKIHGTSEAWR